MTRLLSTETKACSLKIASEHYFLGCQNQKSTHKHVFLMPIINDTNMVGIQMFEVEAMLAPLSGGP
jgi:hypothetical protein